MGRRSALLAILFSLCGSVVLAASVPADPFHRTLDTQIISGPTGTVGSSSVTFSFTMVGDHDDGFQCRLDSTNAAAWESCTSPKAYSSLPDGPHSFEVRGVDTDNDNELPDPTPARADFAVDTQPPQTTISSGPSGTIATSSASFEFTSSEEGSFECRLDSEEESAWAPCSSPQGYASLPDGPHSFEVRARDAVGNVDPTPARAISRSTPSRRRRRSARDPAARSRPARRALNSPAPRKAASNAASTPKKNPPGPPAARRRVTPPCPTAHTASKFGPGMRSATSTRPPPARISRSTPTPPQTTISSGPSGTIATSSASFEFTSSEEGSFECRLDSEEESAWAPCSSPQGYASLPTAHTASKFGPGTRLGNVDPTPARANFAVDTQPPQTTISSGPSGTIATSSASFEFTSSEEGSFECRLDSEEVSAWAPCSSPQGYASLPDGPHSFEVRARDAVGNVDPTPARANFAVDTGPPSPVAGVSVNLEPVEGNVEVQCPGEDEYSRLTSFKQVPLGCLVNTRNGVVNLTASKGQSDELQSSHFWGGLFIVTQEAGDNRGGEPEVDRSPDVRAPHLEGGSAHGSRAGVRELRGRRGGGRRLWGSGKGNYTTSGSYGSATVRGTTWLVVDRCDASTLFKVSEGTVWVNDFVKHRLIVLTAGDEIWPKRPFPASTRVCGPEADISRLARRRGDGAGGRAGAGLSEAFDSRRPGKGGPLCGADMQTRQKLLLLGVLGCRHQRDRVVLCRIFDRRGTERQGNFVCSRLVRLSLDPRSRRVPVTVLSSWRC